MVAIVINQAFKITYRICSLYVHFTLLWWDTAVRQQHLAAKAGTRFGVSLMDPIPVKGQHDHVTYNTDVSIHLHNLF